MRQWGLPGVIIGLLCLWVWIKDRQAIARSREHEQAVKELNQQLLNESRLRVEDAKAFTTTALDLHKQVSDAVGTVSQSLEEGARLYELVDRFTRSVEKLLDRTR